MLRRGSPVQSPGQVLGSVPVGERRIFLLQEGVFVSDGVGHRLLVVNVQLAPAHLNTPQIGSKQIDGFTILLYASILDSTVS